MRNCETKVMEEPKSEKKKSDKQRQYVTTGMQRAYGESYKQLTTSSFLSVNISN